MIGTVYKSTGSWYKIKTDKGDFIKCRIRGKMRTTGIESTNPVAVGDLVRYNLEDSTEGKTGIITEVLNRENYLVRKSVNLSRKKHIIASNIDRIFLVITLRDPITTTVFIDRFLVSAQAFGVDVVLVFNKLDLYSEDEMSVLSATRYIYESIGYKCMETSIYHRQTIELLKSFITGKTGVFSGHSGVGKSALINAMEPGLELSVKKISESHKQGQHTTTFAEMFDLSFGGSIIDSPGIRGFGIIDIDDTKLPLYFREFFKLQQYCKFYNCRHINEPKCAVIDALERGEIAKSRYESYIKILAENKLSHR